MGIEASEGRNRRDGFVDGALDRRSCPFVGRHIRTELIASLSALRGARERIARPTKRGEVNGECSKSSS